MNRYILVLLLGVFISGCAVTPKTRFSEFYKEGADKKHIDLIIDTFIVSDIKGSDIGVNKTKNQEASELVRKGVIELLEERGYTVNLAYIGNGISYERSDKQQYVYSEEWESIGEEYKGPVAKSASDPWVTDESQIFLKRLIKRGKAANVTVADKRRLVPRIKPEEIPEFVNNLPSRHLMLVSLSAGEVGSGKSIGTGILTGVLSAALTGGMYVYSSTTVSGSTIDITLFDKETSRISWNNGLLQGPKYKVAHKRLVGLFKYFPTVNGEILPPTPSESLNSSRSLTR
ncbi:MAG: hypothetical protein ACI93R_000866 [Flavobacteriales bacterium]|jgi:hypothetical protein